jgi:hypothetical protein
MKRNILNPKHSNRPTKHINHVPLTVALVIFALLGTISIPFSGKEVRLAGSSPVYAETCVTPVNYPPPPVGGMTYTNWHFDTSQNISSLQFTINIFNNPGDTSDEYLQLYDANIDNVGQYFGIQTTGTIIFSQWNTSNLSDIELGPGATEVNSTESGSQFISLRYAAGGLPVGQYTVNMTRTNYDGTGDWFAYYLTLPAQAQRYIGSIRFPRANPSVPASFKDGGGSWTEFWDNNGNTTLYPVPLWHVNLEVRANSNLVPNSAISSYSTMPNSDIYAESPGGYVDFVIGGSTPRCHAAGYLWENINQTPTPTPTPKPTTTKPTTTTSPTPAPTPSTKTSTTATPTVAPSSTTPTPASMSITVTSASGKKLVDAKVVLDNKQTSYTNSKGIAEFSAVSSGEHTIVVTQAGNKPTQEKVSLTPGENEILTVKLTSNRTGLVPRIFMVAATVVVLLLAAGYCLKVILRRKDLNKHFPTTISPSVTPMSPIGVSTTTEVVTPTPDMTLSNSDANMQPSELTEIPVATAPPPPEHNEEISELPKPTIYPNNS